MARKPHPTPEMRSDAQLREALDLLFYKESFVNDVKEIREEFSIPKFVLIDHDDATVFASEDESRQNKIKRAAEELALKYEVPSIYAYWIESFIMLGYDYERFLPSGFDFIPTLGVGWDFSPEKGYIGLRLYPGVSKNGVVESVQDYWPAIEMMLDHYVEKGGFKFPTVRARPYVQHAEVYDLFKKGEIRSTGRWMPDTDDGEPPACLKGLSTDQIKRIVSQERKKEKMRLKERE